MAWLPCPYLGREVELTDERRAHIAFAHSLGRPVEEAVADVLLDPDEVRHRPWRYSQLLFVRIGEDGDRVVVVTVDDEPIDDQRPPRTWVVTAFATPDEPLSALLWVKS